MKKLKLVFACMLAVVLALSSLSLGIFADGASDGKTIGETVNLIYVKKNERGTGYSWDNINDVFTMTSMCIDTDDSYGLRLPDGATIMLEGDNVIRASYCAISIEGSVTVKGNGTLTLYSDTYGMVATNADQNKKISFLGGSVKIVSGGDGIYTENMIVTQNDKGKLEVSTTADNSYSINARQIKLLGGKFTADSPICSRDIKITGMDMDLACESSAIVIKGANADDPWGKVKMSMVSVKAGEDRAALSIVDTYSGEKCISTKLKKEYTATSMFYGDSVAGYWDFVTIGIAVLVIAAVVATPFIKHKAELKKVEEAKARARAQEEAARKEAQKQKYDIKK